MGQLDGTLSALGIEQAKDAAKKLKDTEFDQAWSSDLKRCVDTAKFILQYHPDLELQTTDTLREVNYGEFQGRPSAEIQPFFKQMPDFFSGKIPAGESHLDMFRRVIRFINELLDKYPSKRILLVTHTGPIEAIRASVEKSTKDELFPKDALHASIWDLEITESLILYPTP